jgi:hypothetical protein
VNANGGDNKVSRVGPGSPDSLGPVPATGYISPPGGTS